MKRLKKSFSGILFWSYVLWIFSGVIFVLLAVKLSIVFACILAVLYTFVLASIITGHVFLKKTNIDLFKLFMYIGLGSLAFYILGALLLEVIYTAQKQAAVYAWVMIGLGIAIGGLIGWRFFVKLKALLTSEEYQEYVALEKYKKEQAAIDNPKQPVEEEKSDENKEESEQSKSEK